MTPPLPLDPLKREQIRRAINQAAVSREDLVNNTSVDAWILACWDLLDEVERLDGLLTDAGRESKNQHHEMVHLRGALENKEIAHRMDTDDLTDAYNLIVGLLNANAIAEARSWIERQDSR